MNIKCKGQSDKCCLPCKTKKAREIIHTDLWYCLKTVVQPILLMRGESFSRLHFEIFFLFSPEYRLCNVMQIVKGKMFQNVC